MTALKTLYATASRPALRLCRDEGGATAIEYAMIAAGVGAFIAGTVFSLGSDLKTTFYDKLASILP